MRAGGEANRDVDRVINNRYWEQVPQKIAGALFKCSNFEATQNSTFEELKMDIKSFKSFFMRFSKERLLSLCTEYELNNGLTKSILTKDYLCRLLAEESTVNEDIS